MPTKFYLHSATTGVSGTLPTASATISATTPTKIASGVNRDMDSTIGTSQTSQSSTNNSGTSAQSALLARWVSDPISAQTIASQQITVQAGISENNAASNFQMTWSLCVWRPSTGAIVGRIKDLPTAGTEAGTSEANSAVNSGGSSTSVTAQDGDVLILEIWRSNLAQASSTARTSIVYYNGTTEGSTSSNAAYLLFTNNITMVPVTFNGVASFSAQSSLTATGRIRYHDTVTLSAQSSLTANGNRKFNGVASFSAQSSLTATGSIRYNDTVTLSADSSLAANGTVTTPGAGGHADITITDIGPVSGAGITQLGLTLPSDLQGGDYVVLQFSTTANGTLTTPSGWTKLINHESQSVSTGTYVKYAEGSIGSASSETSTTITVTCETSGRMAAIGYALRGVDQSTAVDVTPTSVNETTTITSFSYTGLTTATEKALLIAIGSIQNTGTTQAWTPPTGFSTHVLNGKTTSGSGDNVFIGMAAKFQTSTGATGDLSDTWAVASNTDGWGDLLSIRPAVTGGGGPSTLNGVASFSSESSMTASGTVTGSGGGGHADITFTELTPVGGTGTTTLGIVLPADLQGGDYVVLRFSADANTTLSLPSGWTRLFDGQNSSVSASLYVKYASGTVGETSSEADTTITVTFGVSTRASAVGISMRGVDQTTAMDVALSSLNTAQGGSSLTYTGVTTVTEKSVLIASASYQSAGTTQTWTPPTGFTHAMLGKSMAGSGSNSQQAMAIKVQTTAGASGDFTDSWNVVSTGDPWSQLLAIRPAAIGGPSTVSGIASFSAQSSLTASATTSTLGNEYADIAITDLTPTSGQGVSSLGIVLPSGLQGGDYVVLVFATSVNNSTMSLPSGWTRLIDHEDISVSASVYVKYAAGSVGAASSEAGTTITVNFSASGRVSATGISARGVDPTIPLDASIVSTTANETDTSYTYPSLTTITEKAVLVVTASWQFAGTSLTWTQPSGFSHALLGKTAASSGDNSAAAIAILTEATIGTYGPFTDTWSAPNNVSNVTYADLLVLRPATVGVATVRGAASFSAASSMIASTHGGAAKLNGVASFFADSGMSLDATVIYMTGSVKLSWMSDIQGNLTWTTDMSNMLTRLNIIDPDYLITGGDMAADGLATQYAAYDDHMSEWYDRSLPVHGNHDNLSGSIQPWWNYFGSRIQQIRSGASVTQPWWSVDIGGWHLVGLSIASGGSRTPDFDSGSAQYNWLASDLAANAAGANHPVAGFWHMPRYSTDDSHGDSVVVTDIAQLFYTYHAQLVINGHVHINQRFPKADFDANLKPDDGVIEFTSSGANYRDAAAVSSDLVPDYRVAPASAHADEAMLTIVLTPYSWSWDFIRNTDGQSLDSGSINVGSGGPNVLSGVASFSSQSSLTANGKRKAVSAASFSAQSSLTVNGKVKKVAVALFSAQSSMISNSHRIPVEVQEIETFEGTEGADYTVSSGIADGGSGTGIVYSAAARVTGNRGIRLTSNSGTLQWRQINFGGSPEPGIIWTRYVVRMSPPGSNYRFSEIKDTNGNILSSIRVNADGTLIVQDGINSRDTSEYVVDGSYIQLSHEISGGSVRLSIYNMQGTHLETILGVFTNTDFAPESMNFGILTDPGTSSYVIDMDEVGYNIAREVTPLNIANVVNGVASFTSESSLTANGKRKAVAAASFTSQSSLTANGTRRARGIASFTAQSSLTANGTKRFNGVVSFTAQSSLTVNGTRRARGIASFSAQSSMTANGTKRFNGIASFSSQSSLTVNGKMKAVASASFMAQSSLTANGIRHARGIASFSSESSMTTNGIRKIRGYATFTSESSLTANGLRHARGITSFSAQSSMTANGTKRFNGIVSFSSQSSLTANGKIKKVASASFSAQSSMTANGTKRFNGITSFSSQSSLTVNGKRKAVAAASFSAQSSLTANGTKRFNGIVSFISQSSLTANGKRKAVSAASFSAQSSLTSNGTRRVRGIASFSAEGSMSTNGLNTIRGYASFSSETSLTANGKRKAVAAASFSAQSSLTANGTKRFNGIVAFTSQSSLMSNGTRHARGIASFTSQSSMTANGTKRFNGIVSFTSQSSLTANGKRKAVAAASLTAQSSITPNATRKTFGVAHFTSEGILTTNGVSTLRGTCSLSSQSSITANGKRKAVASITLSSQSVLMPNGTVKKFASTSLSAQSSMTANPKRKAVASISLSAQSSLIANGKRKVIGVAYLSATSDLITTVTVINAGLGAFGILIS